MQVSILGPLEVLDGDGRRIELPGRQKVLLAMLAVEVGRVVSCQRLIEALWGEDLPAHPANALQGRVSQLRRLVGRDVVSQRGGGYALELPREAVDSHRFEALAGDGQRQLAAGEIASARRTLCGALALWRGGALEDVADATWAATEAHRLEDLRMVTLEGRIEADLTLGECDGLTVELTALVDRHPYRERLRGQLMLALYRAGRQADALDAFARGRDLMAGELGLEPGPELQRLQAAVLAQDPTLVPPAPAADVVTGEVTVSVARSPDALSSAPDPTTTPIRPEVTDTARIRVVLVDDDPLVRSAVSTILDATPDVEIVAQASNGRQALEAIEVGDPDVVLMDLHMPELDGIETTRRVCAGADAPKVVMLTTFEQNEHVVRALEAGASGFLLKRSDPTRLPEAVRTVARGDALIDPGVTRALLTAFVQRVEAAPVEVLPHERLDASQRAAFDLLARGRSDAEIADALGVSADSVAALVRGLHAVLGVRDRAQAVVYAYQHGLVETG